MKDKQKTIGGIKNGYGKTAKIQLGIQTDNSKFVSFRQNLCSDT